MGGMNDLTLAALLLIQEQKKHGVSRQKDLLVFRTYKQFQCIQLLCGPFVYSLWQLLMMW